MVVNEGTLLFFISLNYFFNYVNVVIVICLNKRSEFVQKRKKRLILFGISCRRNLTSSARRKVTFHLVLLQLY